MRAPAFTLAVALLALFGGAQGTGASDVTGGEGFLTVVVVVGKDSKVPHRFQVPVVKRGERKTPDDKKRAVGWKWTESCPEDIGCGGRINVLADYVTEESSKVTVALEYKDRKRCDQSKESAVIRGTTTEFKMKCGARVAAYYGPPRAAN